MAEHQEFRVEERSRRDHLVTIGTSLLFIAAIAIALLSQPWLRSTPAYVLACVADLVLLWVLVREVRMMLGWIDAPIVIDAHGVRYASPGEIAWTDVAGIEPVPAQQRVDLLDAKGRVRVSLRYDLEDAADLLQFVADMLADRWPQKTLPHDFGYRLSWQMLAAGATPIAVLGTAAYLLRGRPTIELACVGAAASILMGYLAVWTSAIRRLAIRTDGITVTKGTMSSTLNFPNITAIAIALVRRGRSEHRLDVKVTSRDKSATYVLPRRCDPFDVYATLKGAWERGRTSAAPVARIPVPAA